MNFESTLWMLLSVAFAWGAAVGGAVIYFLLVRPLERLAEDVRTVRGIVEPREMR